MALHIAARKIPLEVLQKLHLQDNWKIAAKKIILSQAAGVNLQLTFFAASIFRRYLDSLLTAHLSSYFWLFILVFYITNAVTVPGFLYNRYKNPLLIKTRHKH